MAEFIPDAFGRSSDRGLVGDVELDSASVALDCLRRRLATIEVARSDEDGEIVRSEVLGDLQADAFVGSGDQSDGCGVHDVLLALRG